MFRGNRQRVLSLGIGATGMVIVILGIIGYYSGRMVRFSTSERYHLRTHWIRPSRLTRARLNMKLRILQIAHRHSSAHRPEVGRSELCRCFFCLATFHPTEIEHWIEDRRGDTAICPRCGIDSVIGSASGIDMSDAFFGEMRTYWFS